MPHLQTTFSIYQAIKAKRRRLINSCAKWLNMQKDLAKNYIQSQAPELFLPKGYL